MTARVVLANGMFRSGSTFFFDVMRKGANNVCFYEPFHPKMNLLISQEHQSSLGHSLTASPWLEHIHYSGLEEYFNYPASLPSYIVEHMGYYSPLQMTTSARKYFESLPQLAARLQKNIFACFNRAAFILPQALQSIPEQRAVVAYTKRPSIQIAISFQRLYSRKRSFCLFTRELRDPWGISLLFRHHYTEYSCLYRVHHVPPHLFSFLAKICYINAAIDQQMSRIADFVFDISGSVEAYAYACRALLGRLHGEFNGQAIDDYLHGTYRQDCFPGKIRHGYFGRYDRELLDSIGFAEFQ
jgi:hypothetical protein